MNDVVSYNFSNSVPAFLRSRLAADVQQSISAGLPVGGWARISYRGSRWRLISSDGVETVMPQLHLDIVMIAGNPNMSKRWYDGDYNPNAEPSAPDCWADNGVGPGPRVPEPVSQACATCDFNKWGSDTGGSGKPTKACSDIKRLAVGVYLPDQNNPAGALQPISYELDIPGASLKNLAEYARTIQSNGASVQIVKTRITFSPDASFPQLCFTALDWISEADNALVTKLNASEVVLMQVGLAETAAPVPQRAAQPIQAPQDAPPPGPAPHQAPPTPATAQSPQPAPAAVTPSRRGRPRKDATPPQQTAPSIPPSAQPSSLLFGAPQPTPSVPYLGAGGMTGQQVIVQNPPTSAAVDSLVAGIFPGS